MGVWVGVYRGDYVWLAERAPCLLVPLSVCCLPVTCQWPPAYCHPGNCSELFLLPSEWHQSTETNFKNIHQHHVKANVY